jgi:aminomuconate-semialdehyde/2-hydroxymuconate-6-semialdehyde dehydrogenase
MMITTSPERVQEPLRVTHLIGGREMDSANGATFASRDPHDNSFLAEVALGGSAEVDLAVAAARQAFKEGPWARMGAAERGILLRRLADLIDANAVELAFLEARDVGRPFHELLARDIPRSAHNFRFFADQADGTSEERLDSPTASIRVRYEAAGVVAAISPWNFPLMLASWKVAPALAYGNTVVLKPAEQSPLTAFRLGQLARDAGLPPGVLNVVHGEGPGSAGEALTRHPDVCRITFTGESATGRSIMAAAAENLTPVSFELGGKSPNVVFADADLELAARETIRGSFWNAGQVCVAGSRVYVERAVYEEFLDRLAILADGLEVGDPLAPGTVVGPLIAPQHRDRVEARIAESVRDARVIRRGGRPEDPSLAAGNYLEPTIIADLPNSALCMREEIFGPLLAAAPFDGQEEAVRLANDSPYGLSAMLFTGDSVRAQRVSDQLRAGTVWVNCFYNRDLRVPFGGMGASGIGREGGSHSRDFFTEPKAVFHSG